MGMITVGLEHVKDFFRGKTVAIVGSAPSCLDNRGEHIDGHDVVIRINNYKIKGFEEKVGKRCDVHYSFYGNSIRTTAEELKRDGCKMHMAKCPDGVPINCDWHIERGKNNGVDFTYIYKLRKVYWVAPLYLPTCERYRWYFDKIGHSPTTGFSCILEVLDTDAKSIYMTGFDFFSSGMHNVNEAWREGDQSDPLRHVPDAERDYIRKLEDKRLIVDKHLEKIL